MANKKLTVKKPNKFVTFLSVTLAFSIPVTFIAMQIICFIDLFPCNGKGYLELFAELFLPVFVIVFVVLFLFFGAVVLFYYIDKNTKIKGYLDFLIVGFVFCVIILCFLSFFIY